MTNARQPVIQVIGNNSIDNAVLDFQNSKEYWEHKDETTQRVFSLPGGGNLLHQLLSTLFIDAKAKINDFQSIECGYISSSYSHWTRINVKNNKEKNIKHYRLIPPPIYYESQKEESENQSDANSSRDELEKPTHLVIFSRKKEDNIILKFLEKFLFDKDAARKQSIEEIYIRFHYPEHNKRFIDEFDQELSMKTTLLLTISDLRKPNVQVGNPLSWEKTFDEVVKAIHCYFIPKKNGTIPFKRIIVTFPTAGAIIVKKGSCNNNVNATLIFGKDGQEGDWISQQGKGRVFGYNVCILASLIQADINNVHIDNAEAIKKGLSLARELHNTGYELKEGKFTFPYDKIIKMFREMEIYNYSPLFRSRDIKNFSKLILSLKENRDPAKEQIWKFLNDECKRSINACDFKKPIQEELKNNIINEFNKILKKPNFYNTEAFKAYKPNKKSTKKLEREIVKLKQNEVQDINRSLFELIYPYNIATYKCVFNKIDINKFHKESQTIFENLYSVTKREMNTLAKRIVENGIEKTLNKSYIEKIGNWKSIERIEIEKIRSLKNRIDEYLKGWEHREKPLSIAVFGSPGSGKSFIIKQILESYKAQNKESKVAMETHNLSQLGNSKELIKAFHRIRDLNLKKIIPCIFWDEFDTPLEGKALGWIRHFIAPMQDSEFYENGFIRPCGPGIFIFAGGTCKTFYEFYKDRTLNENEIQVRKNAKLPDFLSRLDATLDLKGINSNDSTFHNSHFIKRAILLRSLIENNFENLVKLHENGTKECCISPKVIYKFISEFEFKNGARSLEKLLQSCSLEGKSKFIASYIPSEEIIEIHTKKKASLYNKATSILRCITRELF